MGFHRPWRDDSLRCIFIIVAVYLVSSYVPTIEWRGPIDYIAVWSYILAVIPAVFYCFKVWE